jgi:hypothetical protein
MILAIALQIRILDAAERHLGPAGESILRTTARVALNTPFEDITYAQLPAYFAAIERSAPQSVGRELAEHLADQIVSLESQPLQRTRDARLPDRLVVATRKYLGPAAEPFLTNAAGKVGASLWHIDQRDLARLIELIEAEASGFLGQEVAENLVKSIKALHLTTSAAIAARVRALARVHGGPGGERVVNDICRRVLGIELKKLGADGLGTLAAGIREEGPYRFGVQRTHAFLDAARDAVSAPGAELRARVLQLVKDSVGPVGSLVLDEVCNKHGFPYYALTYEHVMWLTTSLEPEIAAGLNAQDIDRLNSDLQQLLTEPVSRTAAMHDRPLMAI